MRIYLLADTAAHHTRRWATWFAHRGHEVHTVSFNPNGLPGYEPAVVHSLWNSRAGTPLVNRALKIPFILARLRSLFRLYPPDIVHAHSAGGYAWATMLSGFRPYIVTPWGTDVLVDIKESRANYWLTRQALNRAALVTTDGFHFVDALHDLGVSDDHIRVQTFGTDVNFFSPGEAQGEHQTLNIGDGPVIISTRTLNPVHDVETFIRAIPTIHEAFPSSSFIVVGDGKDRASLESLTEQLGVKELTIFTGMIEEDRMQSLLRIADVYVSTSLMDAGLAASTAEAMSTALPVVQTNNSDNAYWTPEGEGGLLFKNRDAEALAGAVCRLLENEPLRLKMGEHNRKIIIDQNNADIEMSRMERQYRRLAKGQA